MSKAAVILVIKDGFILSVSRRSDKTRFGLPGGKASEGESPEDCAKRECAEETGINVRACVEVFKRTVAAKTKDGQDFDVYCFYATEWDGEPKNLEEGIEVKWLSEYELVNAADKGGKGAFPEYNTNSIASFKKMFPNVHLFYTGSAVNEQKLCKNCKRPIKDDSNGFCEDLSDKCWKEWCVRQRMPKMPTLRK